jgi:hypothetical protein
MANNPPIGAVAFRKKIEALGKTEAAKIIDPACQNEEQANALIALYVQSLLANKLFAAAGIVLWGEMLWNTRPKVVKKVLAAISKYKKIIIPGAASCSKTYTCAGWLVLRWIADPEGTTIKIISTTGKHAESNFFATVKMFHSSACIPLVGTAHADDILYTEGNKRAAISIVRIRQGEDNSEVLQGFHPLPRQTPHPVYGSSTAVIAALDEAEGIPDGVWTGIDNMTASGDPDHVKAMAFYNPKDITKKPAQLAEPQGGWGEFDVETGVRGSDEWESSKKWHVVRLDAKKTENVEQRREVYANFQTYEYYRSKELQDGGNSQHYFVFARGAYPPDSAINTVCPQRVVSKMRGEFIFSGRTTKAGGLDVAIDGRDDAIFTVGRFGKARAFQRATIGPDGRLGRELITFKHERDAAQVDQQFSIKKGSTEIVADEAKKHCRAMQIEPQWFICDATGNGEPVYLRLKQSDQMGPLVRGIRFGDGATTLKVLQEDTQTAEDQYADLCSEVLFAITRWGEFGFLGIPPGQLELERQLIGRQYKLGPGQTLKVEDKDTYKKRLGRSPDHGDSLSIWLHGIRTGGKVERASMVERKRPVVNQFRQEDIESVQWLADGRDTGF